MPHYDGRVRGPGAHLRRAGEDSPIQEPGYDIEFRVFPLSIPPQPPPPHLYRWKILRLTMTDERLLDHVFEDVQPYVGGENPLGQSFLPYDIRTRTRNGGLVGENQPIVHSERRVGDAITEGLIPCLAEVPARLRFALR